MRRDAALVVKRVNDRMRKEHSDLARAVPRRRSMDRIGLILRFWDTRRG